MSPNASARPYEQFGPERKLTLDECSDLILSVCREYSVVYLVVDAVDESTDDVSQELFRFVCSMQKQV
jgi:hypothetical protein